MPRLCSVCSHPAREAIDTALVAHQRGYRVIAARFGLAATSLQRHAATHLRETLLRSEEMRAMLDSEALAARMRELEAAVSRVLARGEQVGDDRLVLLAVKEGRSDVEVLAKLAAQGDVEERLARLESRARPTPPVDVDTYASIDTPADASVDDR